MKFSVRKSLMLPLMLAIPMLVVVTGCDTGGGSTTPTAIISPSSIVPSATASMTITIISPLAPPTVQRVLPKSPNPVGTEVTTVPKSIGTQQAPAVTPSSTR